MEMNEEQIDLISAKLKKIPRKNKYTKMEIVRRLEKDIDELKRKGYNIQEITSFLQNEGLDISASTLRTYTAKKRIKKENKSDKNNLKNKRKKIKKEMDQKIKESSMDFVKEDPEEL